jgi:hypothetical protein
MSESVNAPPPRQAAEPDPKCPLAVRHIDHAVLEEVTVAEAQAMGENPGTVDHPLDNVGFVFLSDPDANGWAVQQSPPAPSLVGGATPRPAGGAYR